MLTTKIGCAALFAILMAGSTVSAQSTDQSLRDALFGLTADPNLRPLVAAQVGGLANLIGLEVATAPTGASAGGLTFTFDSATGTFIRSSDSFGPSFAERSVTTGRGRASVGVNWLYANYNSIAGQDLDGRELRTVRAVQNLPGAVGTLEMDLSSTSVVTFATYGLSNDLDLAVLVPWTRVSMSATSVLGVGSTAILEGSVPSTSAAGVGDVVLMGKYRFWRGDAGGLAAQLQLSLPTGDEDDLRGLGTTRALLSAIWSREGRFAPHANIGYEFWSDDAAVSDSGVAATGQFKYAFGAEYAAHPRATVVVTALGRRVLGGVRPGYESITIPGFGAIEALVPTDESLNIFSIAPGLKWNAYSNLVISAHLLSALVNDGLRSDTTPMIGVDWTF
jgi:hypothetical protein